MRLRCLIIRARLAGGIGTIKTLMKQPISTVSTSQMASPLSTPEVGALSGLINNQFSLSEHNDYIRVASTTGQWGRWWIRTATFRRHRSGDDARHVVGEVRDIAVNERIWSSRFRRRYGVPRHASKYRSTLDYRPR